MANGNWITGGQDEDARPCVMFSHGDDLTAWDTVKIPVPDGVPISFGETTVLPEKNHVLAIIRPRSPKRALVAESEDFGRTWSPCRPSNLPMSDAKPYADTLSSGQPYLVFNYPAKGMSGRDTLVIATGKPGTRSFDRMWKIRFGPSKAPFGGRAKRRQWSYPYAHEHDGKLYVVYSVSKQDCGLSIIPLRAIAWTPPPKPPEPKLVGHWPCDEADGETLKDASDEGNHGTLLGGIGCAPGARGKGLKLDGNDDLVEVPDAASLDFSDGSFSVAAWVNIYRLGRGQQMIVGKNVYRRDLREWGLMIDKDDRPTLYFRARGWRTVKAKTKPTPGTWCHIAAVVERGRGRIYVNGKLEGEAALGTRLPNTAAPLSIGGQRNAGEPMQFLFGALDEVRLYRGALAEQEVKKLVFPVTETHEVPTRERFPLWDGGPVPTAAEAPLLEDVRFTLIETRQPEVDGWDWLHGAAIIRHGDPLYACWGRNKGSENTVTEVNHGKRSTDVGRTWSERFAIGPGVTEDGRRTWAHSHGVFLSREGTLWAFLARFGQGDGRFAGLRMEAFALDEEMDRWASRGVVAQGIWPLREPEKMTNGNWFVPGCNEHWRAAVAISRGDDLRHWDTVDIPVGDRVYTEATCWIDGADITLVMRNHSPWDKGRNCAAVSMSRDHGRTWSDPVESNLPMTTSKPYAGVLSTGQRYLICTTVRDHGGRRRPLTIAVGRPGEKTLCRVWRIRDGVRPGEADRRPKRLAYPHAIERDGKLYVVYSVGAKGGNRNSCELAVFPVGALAVD
jgi:hypothetical protein